MIYNKSILALWAGSHGTPVWSRANSMVEHALQEDIDKMSKIHPVCERVLGGLRERHETVNGGVYIGIDMFAYQIFQQHNGRMHPVDDIVIEEYPRKVADGDAVLTNPDGVSFELFYDATNNVVRAIELISDLYKRVDYRDRAFGIFGTNAQSIIAKFVNTYNIGV